MKNRYGKLAFRHTSYFRIAARRFALRMPLAVSALAQSAARISAIRSSDASPVSKKLAIARCILDTSIVFTKSLLA